MMKLLIATALSALVFAANSNAQEAQQQTNTVLKEVSLTVPFKEKSDPQPTIQMSSKIGIARIENGRLISAPMAELRNWAALDKLSDTTFAPISPVALFKNVPMGPKIERESENKLDEIRITASDLNMDYVLIYGMGGDAQWGSFAGQAMAETGFTVDKHTISPRGEIKALLVNTYTGKVYGTVVSDILTFNISNLTQKVDALINALTKEPFASTA